MKKNTWKTILRAAQVLLLSNLSALQAQYLISANPADRGDPRVSFSNPAIVANQNRLLSVGSKALFFGAVGNGLDLTHSYFTLTSSRRKLAGIDDIGYGVHGQVLHTPMFNAVSVSALFARQWSEKFALGLNLGFANRGFDTGSFILDDPDDPLTQSPTKWIFPDLGVGIMVVPTPHLTLGVGINHLTQPSYALSDTVRDAYLPRSISTGLAFGFGNSLSSFRVLMSVSYEERRVLPLFAVEGIREDFGSFMTALGRETAFLDAKLQLLEGIALNLRYSYPLNELSNASSGSPEFGLIFNLDKNFSLYAMEWTEPRVPPRPAISLAHAYLVESAYDTLFITEKFIKRVIADSVKRYLNDVPKSVFLAEEEDSVLPRLPERIFLSEEELASRPKIGALKLLHKFEEEENRSGKFRVPRDSTGIVDLMKRRHTARYMSALRELAVRVQSKPDMQNNFVTPQDPFRTHLILRYLNLFTPLTDSIKVTVADTARAAINRSEIVGTSTDIPAQESRLFLRAAERDARRRDKLVHAPVDTFHFSLNMLETRRWGPVSGAFIMRDAKGRVVLQDSTIVAESDEHNQILRRKIWDWKLDDGDYPPEGNYYYYVVWQSADSKLYRSPERMLRIERDRVTSEIRVTRTMPEITPQTRIKTLVHMN